LDGNGYALSQLMIEDIQNLGIAMDEQIVVIASSRHPLSMSIHIENFKESELSFKIPRKLFFNF
jgi:hypothetical protein